MNTGGLCICPIMCSFFDGCACLFFLCLNARTLWLQHLVPLSCASNLGKSWAEEECSFLLVRAAGSKLILYKKKNTNIHKESLPVCWCVLVRNPPASKNMKNQQIVKKLLLRFNIILRIWLWILEWELVDAIAARDHWRNRLRVHIARETLQTDFCW